MCPKRYDIHHGTKKWRVFEFCQIVFVHSYIFFHYLSRCIGRPWKYCCMPFKISNYSKLNLEENRAYFAKFGKKMLCNILSLTCLQGVSWNEVFFLLQFSVVFCIEDFLNCFISMLFFFSFVLSLFLPNSVVRYGHSCVFKPGHYNLSHSQRIGAAVYSKN